MINKMIYELTQIEVYDYVEGSYKTQIQCHSMLAGYFMSQLNAEDFIKKHNDENNCFFILRTYVLNPKHLGQTREFIFEITYDHNGEILCKCDTHHFVVNYHELDTNESTKFKGRSKPILKAGDIGWYYDDYNNILQKCIVSKPPINKRDAKKYEWLDWYDDSYLIYPLIINYGDNHQHIISCYMFTKNMIKKLLPI